MNRRTFLGLIGGISTCLIFTISFTESGNLLPVSCMLLAMLISGVCEPKPAARLGAWIGLVTGAHSGLILFLERPVAASIPEWLVGVAIFSIGALGLTAYFVVAFALMGLTLGIYMKSHKHGIIF
jgi:hypothetical protein